MLKSQQFTVKYLRKSIHILPSLQQKSPNFRQGDDIVNFFGPLDTSCREIGENRWGTKLNEAWERVLKLTVLQTVLRILNSDKENGGQGAAKRLGNGMEIYQEIPIHQSGTSTLTKYNRQEGPDQLLKASSKYIIKFK